MKMYHNFTYLGLELRADESVREIRSVASPAAARDERRGGSGTGGAGRVGVIEERDARFFVPELLGPDSACGIGVLVCTGTRVVPLPEQCRRADAAPVSSEESDCRDVV